MKTHKVTLSMESPRTSGRVDVIEGDSGRKIRCDIGDMKIPDGSTARIYARKPSNLEIYNDCTIEDGCVIVELTTQMTAEIGDTRCQVEVTNAEENVTSFEFTLKVHAKLKSSGSIESTNEFTALENALENAQNFAIDQTLTVAGQAADAKVVGDKFSQLSSEIDDLKESGTGMTVTSDVINYDLNVKAVNHRGYSTEAPENTIPAYILSKKKGFTYVECDVSFTSDGVAVLLHDGTIDRTSNGSGSISSMTYAEVLMYDFGSWKSSDYTGTKIPTFEEFIMTCKGIGLHPYIELKSNGGYTQEQIIGIVDMVESCGMEGKVTYISFNATFLGYVKTADSKARLGYLADVTDSTIATANDLKTGENEVFMDVSYSNVTEEKVALCIENELPLEIWTVNSQSVIESMNNYVSGVTSDSLIAGKILYDKYMTYTPPDSPDVPATGITLDKSTLTFDDVTTQTLVATVEPAYSTDTVVWDSSDEDVASVTNGIVTPVSKGTATITATAGSVSAKCEVTVNVEEIVTYTITRNLTNCSSDSVLTSINQGVHHTETFIADTGYILDVSSISITMGGYDISSSCIDGVLTIESVTGDIIISVSAVKKGTDVYESWDFTTSTVSSIGNEAILGTNVTQDNNGLHLSGSSESYAKLSEYTSDVSAIEIDIAELGTENLTGNNRFVMTCSDGELGNLNPNCGFIYRSTGKWNVYGYDNNVGYSSGSWDTDSDLSDISEFEYSTLRLELGYGTTAIYKNGVLLREFARSIGYFGRIFCLGAFSNSIGGTTITGFRIYK